MRRRENGVCGGDDDDDDDDDDELHTVFMAAPVISQNMSFHVRGVSPNLAPLRNTKSLHLANMHASEITNHPSSGFPHPCFHVSFVDFSVMYRYTEISRKNIHFPILECHGDATSLSVWMVRYLYHESDAKLLYQCLLLSRFGMFSWHSYAGFTW